MTDSNATLATLILKEHDIRDRLALLDTEFLDNMRAGMSPVDAQPVGYADLGRELDTVLDAIDEKLAVCDVAA